MSAELIEHLFLPALGERGARTSSGDSAVLELGGARIAFSTDSFVVRPLFFPGGSIGDLAVNGTVNDLAMSGAVPAYLSAGFILEEGTDLSVVGRVAERLGAAARAAGVTRGHRRHEGGRRRATATGSTSTPPASGWSRTGSTSPRTGPRVGDVVIVSGDIGVHGVGDHERARGPGVRHRGAQRLRAAVRPGGRDARRRARPARAARPDPRRAGHVAQRDRRRPRRSASSWTRAGSRCPRW